jgi:signal transduction histidine kinase
MRTLIDDLLMFSRVTTNARPFVPVDLAHVARQVIDDIEVTVAETGATITQRGLPTIDADPLQMRQLLQNLVTNALKFRAEGVPPKIDIEGRRRGAVVEITVSDNGIGFEPQYATRIFRAFERLHGIGAYPGTGIGLALCRKIVERHLGTITAQGRPGRGATFTVTLPAAQRQEAPQGEPDDQQAMDGARNRD